MLLIGAFLKIIIPQSRLVTPSIKYLGSTLL